MMQGAAQAGLRAIAPLMMAALAGAALTGCLPSSPGTSLVPEQRPAALPASYQPPSVESAELRNYFRVLQQDLLTRGLLRTDGGGPETPFDADDLAEHFEEIAFYNEYAGRSGSGLTGGLSRWSGPVKLVADFGPSVPPSQRQRDLDVLSAYGSRLSRVTGHTISTSARQGNFHVIFAGADDRAYVAEKVRDLLPNLSDNDLQLFVNLPRSHYCFVLAGGPPDAPFDYIRGVALIRAEHPDLVRDSCIHEEVAQGLGLLNDSPKVRPSIFNDDDEFAYLTSHDELLLKMLYDPRLRTGMGIEEARPLIRIIARDVMGQQL
ncbi:lipoprotein, putative [Roseobacter sp. MED193]|nr:lipoprotein, putative [Roseobacter sp. MED193]